MTFRKWFWYVSSGPVIGVMHAHEMRKLHSITFAYSEWVRATSAGNMKGVGASMGDGVVVPWKIKEPFYYQALYKSNYYLLLSVYFRTVCLFPFNRLHSMAQNKLLEQDRGGGGGGGGVRQRRKEGEVTQIPLEIIREYFDHQVISVCFWSIVTPTPIKLITKYIHSIAVMSTREWQERLRGMGVGTVPT